MTPRSDRPLASALRTTRDAAIVAHPDGRIVAWNPAAERVLGFTARDALAGGCCAIFGGLESGAAPFAQLDDPGFDPLAPYAGSADPFVVRTSSDTTLRLTTPGDQGEVTNEDPVTVEAVVVGASRVPETGETVVDVSVPEGDAADLAARAATGRVALVLDTRER